MARSDRIWLIRILLIGCLGLSVIHLSFLGIFFWKNRGEADANRASEVAEAEADLSQPSSASTPETGEPETSVQIHPYPVFRGKWLVPSIRRFPRGI